MEFDFLFTFLGIKEGSWMLLSGQVLVKWVFCLKAICQTCVLYNIPALWVHIQFSHWGKTVLFLKSRCLEKEVPPFRPFGINTNPEM